MARAERGLTLLEVAIASTLLGAIVSMAYLMLHAASAETANQSVHLSLEGAARETLEQLARELRMADAIVPAQPLVAGDPQFDAQRPWRYTEISFGVLTAYDIGTRNRAPSNLFADSILYRWAPDLADPTDGKDNDRDGITDEGMIEKVVARGGGAPAVSRISHDVSLKGLFFELDPAAPRSVTLSLSLARRDTRGIPVSRTATITVHLRN
jgi:prepilin-type N-terminal cleavage/methylation domain-containing protein